MSEEIAPTAAEVDSNQVPIGVQSAGEATAALLSEGQKYLAKGDDEDDEDGDDDDDFEHDAEIIRITKPVFDNPISLINLEADMTEFLSAKRISDVSWLSYSPWDSF